MTIREELEQREQTILKDPRSWSINSLGRDREEEESDMRTCYMRDRDRILHCKSFRRMKHKTQVFLAPDGDHYRTRLTHTLEVSQVARTLARALRLNEDLTEAIAETLPEARLAVCCDLTKLHEKTLYGSPREVLANLKANEKTEKGEYCIVLDLHGVAMQEKKENMPELPLEAQLVEAMKKGRSLREAQEVLIAAGEKKNAVKQAALTLKKLFE